LGQTIFKSLKNTLCFFDDSNKKSEENSYPFTQAVDKVQNREILAQNLDLKKTRIA
jgi:hypothetical protein